MQGTFVAITANGETAYSYDGISWKQLTGTSEHMTKLLKVDRRGGYFIRNIHNCNEFSKCNEKGVSTISKNYLTQEKLLPKYKFLIRSGYPAASNITITDNRNTIDVPITM